MDFKKPQSSFDKIFLEIGSDSDSDSDSSSDSDSELENMNTIFDNKPVSSSAPIQELLTHISSPKSNEEFIMPFQDYSLVSEQPVIKLVHRPRSKSSKRSKKSRRSSKKSKSSRRVRHHNYPSKRKSPRRSTSRRS